MVPGLGAARPAFPGREFQSHLTVPLRRLYDFFLNYHKYFEYKIILNVVLH
jgi:hypothetical protein